MGVDCEPGARVPTVTLLAADCVVVENEPAAMAVTVVLLLAASVGMPCEPGREASIVVLDRIHWNGADQSHRDGGRSACSRGHDWSPRPISCGSNADVKSNAVEDTAPERRTCSPTRGALERASHERGAGMSSPIENDDGGAVRDGRTTARLGAHESSGGGTSSTGNPTTHDDGGAIVPGRWIAGDGSQASSKAGVAPIAHDEGGLTTSRPRARSGSHEHAGGC